jgi:hypothetical protein
LSPEDRRGAAAMTAFLIVAALGWWRWYVIPREEFILSAADRIAASAPAHNPQE